MPGPKTRGAGPRPSLPRSARDLFPSHTQARRAPTGGDRARRGCAHAQHAPCALGPAILPQPTTCKRVIPAPWAAAGSLSLPHLGGGGAGGVLQLAQVRVGVGHGCGAAAAGGRRRGEARGCGGGGQGGCAGGGRVLGCAKEGSEWNGGVRSRVEKKDQANEGGRKKGASFLHGGGQATVALVTRFQPCSTTVRTRIPWSRQMPEVHMGFLITRAAGSGAREERHCGRERGACLDGMDGASERETATATSLEEWIAG